MHRVHTHFIYEEAHFGTVRDRHTAVQRRPGGGKDHHPVDPGYDLSALSDGIYPVYFDQDAVADSKAVLSIYSEDMFDIVDILDVHVVGTGSALHTAVICFYLSN